MIKLISGIVLSSTLLLTACGGYDVEGPEHEYDAARPYKLPYEAGTSHDLYQGYNGSISHNGEYSLDFLMPLGTPVLAARSGVVEQVVESNTIACPLSKDCPNNYVSVRHADGTLGLYFHIQTNGSCVSSGDAVEQGDAIAKSGNVGISATPHLHFQVVSADPSSLLAEDKPAFVDVNGNGSGFPTAKVAYFSTNQKKTDYCN